MKHVYPVRHPPMPEDIAPATTSSSRSGQREPALPHESDESSASQASATPQQGVMGRKAYGNATDGTADTDRGPVLDAVYNDKVAPGRGPAKSSR